MSAAPQVGPNALHADLETIEELQPIQEQQRRHKALSASESINAILAEYMIVPCPVHVLASPPPPPAASLSPSPTTLGTLPNEFVSPVETNSLEKDASPPHTAEPHPCSGADIKKLYSVATSEVVLAVSPFPNRRPTLWLTPSDLPWDGDAHFGRSEVYVTPSPLPLGAIGARRGWDTAQEASTDCEFLMHTTDAAQGEGGESTAPFFRVQQAPACPILRRIPRGGGGGPYAGLSYVLGDSAVPFTGLLSTLERAGFQRVPARKALLSDSWSLKWIKHPLPSDFKRVRVASFQKVNHFPGTWKLGRKDTLHRALCSAGERWKQCVDESKSFSGSGPHCYYDKEDELEAKSAHCRSVGGDNDRNRGAGSFWEDLFPRGWLLPEEYDECKTWLRNPQHAGELFIVKPAASACGKGVYLLKGGPDVNILSLQSACTTSDEDVTQKGRVEAVCTPPPKRANMYRGHKVSDRFLVQQYISDPYLVYGYKFDLRLYVVVTSYEPMRVYLYKEGLVRFATSPYHKTAPPATFCAPSANSNIVGDLLKEGLSTAASVGAGSASVIADVRCLTAHLTNFTINKKSEDFVIPCSRREGCIDAAIANDGIMVSKWSLAALRAYMEQDGVNWESTMERVEDLLAKVFLSITLDVREELRQLDQSRDGGGSDGRKVTHTKQKATKENLGSHVGPSSSFSTIIPPPPCTVKGISPFFEIYGVDVLLRRGSPESDRTPDITASEAGVSQCETRSAATVVLSPVIMEVNIMPSLSTHYSPLDQCIKGNFIADTLNLVGLTSMSFKPSPAMTSVPYGSGNVDKKAYTSDSSLKQYGNTDVKFFKQWNKDRGEMPKQRADRSSPTLHPLPTASEAVPSVGCAMPNKIGAPSEGDKYGYWLLNHFLRGQPLGVVEACFVCEEERLRSPHFKRLLPTATSFSRYKSLLLPQDHEPLITGAGGRHDVGKTFVSSNVEPNADDARAMADRCCSAPWRSLDEALSAWEAWREKLSKCDMRN